MLAHACHHRDLLRRRRLRLRLRTQNPSAQLIWYDAVTIDGALQWQDTLNVANRPFFEDCDGIFVNYTWKVRVLLATSFEVPKPYQVQRHRDIANVCTARPSL